MARRDAGDGQGGALDPALTQKKRARRRLVGALVLGLAVVIVLPLVLDSEPRQTISDVQIEIPPRDTPLPPKVNEGQARPADGAAASAASTQQPAPPSEKVTPAPSEPVEPPKAAALPRASEEPAAPPKALAAAKPVETSKPTEVPKAEAPRAAEAPKPAASAVPAPATPARADGRFVLQAGAFANAGSAQAQADKARKAGVRVYTETVQTAQGARTRVRIGPFTSREAADQARARLKSVGIDAAVVAL